MRLLVCFSLLACCARAQAPVQGAPYTATVTNESIQALADGNRIVQTSTGTVARDSMGRTRQDAPMLSGGAASRAKAPHMVFVRDPVAEVSYTLNFTDKTAHETPSRAPLPPPPPASAARATGLITLAPNSLPYAVPRTLVPRGSDKPQIEDLGSQSMEGVLVTGVRMTHTIPAGEVGNDKPLSLVSEVWTSPELKTVVYSKRSDPRTGDQTFRLTNIVRAEPDPSLFTIPADFKVGGEQ